MPWFSFNIKDVYLFSQFKLGFSIRPPSFLNKAHVKVYNYVSMLHRIASYLSQSSPYFNRDMNIHKCLRSFYECFMIYSKMGFRLFSSVTTLDPRHIKVNHFLNVIKSVNMADSGLD